MDKPLKARALWDYSAIEDNELDLCVGDYIDIIELCNSDWYEGSINGKTGFFPANRVELIPFIQERSPAAAAAFAQGADKENPFEDDKVIPPLPAHAHPPGHPHDGANTHATHEKDWKSVAQPDGQTYFWNAHTGETAWSTGNGSASGSGRTSASTSAWGQEGPVTSTDGFNASGADRSAHGEAPTEKDAGTSDLLSDLARVIDEFDAGPVSDTSIHSLTGSLLTLPPQKMESGSGAREVDTPVSSPSSGVQNTYGEGNGLHGSHGLQEFHEATTASGSHPESTPLSSSSRSGSAHGQSQEETPLSPISNSNQDELWNVVPPPPPPPPPLFLDEPDEPDTPITTVPPEIIRREGYISLKQKSPPKGTWTTTFAILTVGFLILYPSAKSKRKPSRVLRLSSVQLDAVGRQHTKRKHAFSLVCDEGGFLVQPAKDSEVWEWMDAIREASRERSTPSEYENATSKLFAARDESDSGKQDDVAKPRSRRPTTSRPDEDSGKSNVKSKLGAFLFKRPSVDKLKEKGIIRDEDQVFGGNLATQTTPTTPIPPVITACITQVDRRGLESQGIYRLSGNASTVQKIRVGFNSKESVDLSDEGLDINVVASVLKCECSFFRFWVA
ncbi:hypothetical protein, variant [Spizellomyces punctatus DAOM BR117]|uniref:Uncharacterized protein n=1 Tax=Spizellomyces punctatus (strain DAOM BR117) TaxID=645134 RepID=A0A0L0HJ79_SPIPD|nr:hypothetical protein, variant [Spizellomyces punctatus DAOM BR117]KND01063.1 hypothetical protein, variant [Spizellomyces punctatus DAOM BR117]|eukprot:XP_016609102.1 hypothetical protein, variant [Spizellomyces punctatus DAOM BR117]